MGNWSPLSFNNLMRNFLTSRNSCAFRFFLASNWGSMGGFRRFEGSMVGLGIMGRDMVELLLMRRFRIVEGAAK